MTKNDTGSVPDVPFFQLLSDVWHRVASVVKKISLDRLQPEQIKQDDVKSFECYLFLYV